MSHFTVAVFTDGNKSIEELLAPYQENNMDNCPKEYLEFNSLSEEYRDEYENGVREVVKLQNGEYLYPWDSRCYKDVSKETYDFAKANGIRTQTTGFGTSEIFKVIDLDRVGGELCEVPLKQIYKSLKDYLEDYHDAKFDEDQQDWGYWKNPNAKWDWWTIGGRWSNLLKNKDGTRTDSGRIKELDFSPDKEEFDKACRFWELKIEKANPKNEKDEELIKWDWYKDEYYTSRYKSREDYATKQSLFETYAAITPDGKWHSKGDMGWWGCGSETAEEHTQWQESFIDRFVTNGNPEWEITIVDCHI